MSPRARLIGALLASLAGVGIGVLAAWPIYRTWWLVLAAGVGLALGAGVAILGAKRRWSGFVTAAVLFGAFVVTVVPVAVPQSFERLPGGLLSGLLDGVAGIVLGWKQLLTLTLPVGTYQGVMVPAYLVFLLSSFAAATIALRAGRFAPLAAVPLIIPVAFGTLFGASAVSRSLRLGPFTIAAPRELALWIAAALLGALWVWYSAGAERRAALRRGRLPGEQRAAAGRLARSGIGAATIVISLVAALAIAPLLDGGARQVPRDRIDPEIILRERSSPLASYRGWKRDATLDATLFSVSANSTLPGRLRLAVLDEYDGIDFHVGTDEAGRFTRFPSGDRVREPSKVTVRIGEGYNDIWVPTAGLGSVPSFSGSRAAELADAFYVNRGTGAAIAVPGGAGTSGLTSGDGFSVTMDSGADEDLSGGPVSGAAELDLDAMPELAAWLKAQDQPATAEGLIELLDRLRDRGYLSHSIGESEGEQLWLERLADRYGTRFESSAGGHSLARLEQLFAQLNTQQRLAGENPSPEMLVAGIGDDEQFAAAAALIARAMGFDSRVVLGVRLGDEDAGVPGIPACADECTGENLAAWIEVRGSEGTWAPIDATPQLEMRPTTLEEGEQLPEFPTTPEERDAKEVDPPLGFGERNDNADEPNEESAASWLLPVLRAAGLGASALALLALPLLFLPLAKRRREKARRRETDPELKALGAWQQIVDSAADAGVELPVGASRSRVAEAIGTAPARWAADTVSKAVFSAQGVTEQEAEWMWAAVDADRAEREAKSTRRRRMKAKYALRSYGVKIGWSRARAAESTAAHGRGERLKEPKNV